MLYSCKGDELYGEYFDHGRRAFWLGAEVLTLSYLSLMALSWLHRDLDALMMFLPFEYFAMKAGACSCC